MILDCKAQGLAGPHRDLKRTQVFSHQLKGDKDDKDTAR